MITIASMWDVRNMVDTQTSNAGESSLYNIPFTPDIVDYSRPPLNFILMGTCQVGFLLPTARALGHTVNHMLMESWSHSLVPKFDITNINAAVVSLTLRHIFAGAVCKPLGPADMTMVRLNSAEEVDNLLASCAGLVEQKLTDISSALPGIPTFIISFLEPSFNYSGNLLNPYTRTSPKYIIRELNSRLAHIISRNKNLYYVDINDIINSVGRMHLHDDILSSSLHASFIDEGLTDLDVDRFIAPVSNNLDF
jgi:hypothetical protein